MILLSALELLRTMIAWRFGGKAGSAVCIAVQKDDDDGRRRWESALTLLLCGGEGHRTDGSK
jgi:hypothetical protein